VVEGSLDDVGVAIGGRVVDGSVDEVGAGVLGVSVDEVEGCVVEDSVDDVDAGAVVDVVADGGRVVAGCVGGGALSSASWATMRRTAEACAYAWLGVVVVVNSVEGTVAVDERVVEAAFAISRPAPTNKPPTTAGISI
jgi:hypothetical protein